MTKLLNLFLRIEAEVSRTYVPDPPLLHPDVNVTGSDKYILDWSDLKDTSATLSYSVDFGKLQLDFNKLICGSWMQL